MYEAIWGPTGPSGRSYRWERLRNSLSQVDVIVLKGIRLFRDDGRVVVDGLIFNRTEHVSFGTSLHVTITLKIVGEIDSALPRQRLQIHQQRGRQAWCAAFAGLSQVPCGRVQSELLLSVPSIIFDSTSSPTWTGYWERYST